MIEMWRWFLAPAALTDEQILYLTYITALYDMHAVMSKALRTDTPRSRRFSRLG